MKIKRNRQLLVSELEQNTGQLGWLSNNPRQWTKDDIGRTVKSLEEDGDFLNDRPLLVVEEDGRLVVFGGNLRLTALKRMGADEVPCSIYECEDEEDRDTIKRLAMKDNGSFGAWDFDALANEWDDLPLADWGCPAWNFQERKENQSKPTGEINMGDIKVSYDIQVTCSTIEEQLELIKELDGRGYKCKSL